MKELNGALHRIREALELSINKKQHPQQELRARQEQSLAISIAILCLAIIVLFAARGESECFNIGTVIKLGCR